MPDIRIGRRAFMPDIRIGRRAFMPDIRIGRRAFMPDTIVPVGVPSGTINGNCRGNPLWLPIVVAQQVGANPCGCPN